MHQLHFRQLLPVNGAVGCDCLPRREHLHLWGAFCHFGGVRSGAVFGGVSHRLHLVRRWNLPKRRKLWLVLKLRLWHLLHRVGPLDCDGMSIWKLLFRWRIDFGFLRRREFRHCVCAELHKLRRKQLFINGWLK